jgi:glutamine synthetase
MTWTKSSTITLPATGSRTVKLYTEGGVQYVDYQVVDTTGNGHSARFTVVDVLTAHPEIDSPTFASILAIFRAYGDAQCGFTDV